MVLGFKASIRTHAICSFRTFQASLFRYRWLSAILLAQSGLVGFVTCFCVQWIEAPRRKFYTCVSMCFCNLFDKHGRVMGKFDFGGFVTVFLGFQSCVLTWSIVLMRLFRCSFPHALPGPVECSVIRKHIHTNVTCDACVPHQLGHAPKRTSSYILAQTFPSRPILSRIRWLFFEN